MSIKTTSFLFRLLSVLTLLPLRVGTFGVMTAHAATLIVTNTADSGKGSLRQAIADAATGDIVTFDSSLSGRTIYLVSTLTLFKNVTIDGSRLATQVTISGNNAVSVFYIDSTVTATLHSLTISNGNTNGGGGGIYNLGSLTITNSILSDNSAFQGGGIHNYYGTVSLINSTLLGNSADDVGGGIFNYGGPTSVTNSAVSGSSAALGGGVFNYLGTLNVMNSILSDNYAIQGGGGIHNTGDSTLSVTNSTFSGNSTNGGGGGIRNYGTLSVTNSTLSGNSAPLGGGISNSGGTATVRNTIIAKSTSGGNCHGIITYSSNNIDDGTTCGWGSAHRSMSSTNPLLGALTGSPAYFPLNASSLAIDAGDDAICEAAPVSNTSQNGVTRPQGAHCDIGSYEKALIFADVSPNYWANSYIERLYVASITAGCGTNPLNYCPEGIVTRAQMAVFLERGIHGSSYNPPAVGASTGFGDVSTSYWAAAWIKQLAAEGITGGCGSGNYCPEGVVTRGQMAVFLLRSKHGSSYTPPAVGASTGFGDVSTSYWAAAWIKQLVAEGITAGCGGGNYCPETPVTRAQMAVFLVRTFNLP